MALQYNGVSPTAIKYNGVDLTVVKYNSTPIWGKAYSLSIDGGENVNIKVTRTSSPNKNASIGVLENNSEIYHGDVINIELNVPSNVICTKFSVEGSNVKTSSVIGKIIEKDINISTSGFTFNNYGLTLSGNSVTKWDNSSANASLSIPSSYYYVKDYTGTTRYFISGSSTYEGSTSITDISESAFENCTNLKSVTIPSSVKTLGKYCFMGCSNLANVAMSATPTSIATQAFWGTNLSLLSSSMYNCTSLGQGCFAFKNPWALNTTNESVASRLVATSHNNSNVYGNVYGGAIMGGGARKTGGENGTSGSGTISYRVGDYTSSFTVSMNSDTYISSPTYRVQTSTTNLTIGMTSKSGNFSNDSGGGGVYMGTSMNDRSNSSASESLTAGTLKKRYLNWGVVTTCIVEGTLITLANGTYKPVEDLQYTDLLRVWNLETGRFDYQFPLAIVKGEKHNIKFRITIEDGTYLDICGQHDIFDPVAHCFRTYGEGAIYKVEEGLDYYVMKDNGTDTYTSAKITSIELIEQEVTAYGIITSGIITTFANDMMIGLGVLNLVPITEENKFGKVFENLKESCYTYDKLVTEIYSDVEKDLAIGLNLLMTDIYHKDASGLPNLVAPFRNRKPLPTRNGKKIHNIAFDDGELTTIKSLEDEITVLPEIKTPSKTKWYIVGEYKYLEPGDTYITKFSTVIKAV